MSKFDETYNRIANTINEVYTNTGSGTPTTPSTMPRPVKPKTPQEQQKAIDDAAKILGVDPKRLAAAKAANVLDMDPEALTKLLTQAKITGTAYQA